ncbi:hypothetical protein B0T14DRAFT_541003 [Immersiella caudata]|uniref:Uncharacterized protein n=1 Tax=Immersiella caudata TaxID=314043 RepID=A0AA39TTR8_9PEZI|nr:hypothetical protein B0T14DRAFT_541003 [Immersiella caudata]
MQLTTLLCFLAATVPLALAKGKYQGTGFAAKKQNCINKVQDVTKSGFYTWCIDIPNTTRSFIFSVGGGYNELNMEQCSIFFKTTNSYGGDQVGRSNGHWLKYKLTTNGERMALACVKCQRLSSKRDEGEAGEMKFVRGDDGEWFEEVEEGVLVNAREEVEGLEEQESCRSLKFLSTSVG